MKKLGVYTGGGDVGGVQQFESWLGASVPHAHDFLPWDEAPVWFLNRWRGFPYKVEFSVPMLPTGSTLAEGANGSFDSHWTNLARCLVSNGYSNAVLRVGWEFNGRWYPWFAQTDPPAFRSYWRRIVTKMRAVPGSDLRFDWCPTLSRAHMTNPEDAWPGAKWVNRIGTDVYDSGPSTDPASRWNTYLTQPYGLQWHADFAARHRKALTFPEWGLWSHSESEDEAGDNPLFIERMHNWIQSHHVAAACYFSHDTSELRHELRHFPNAATTFRALFG